jgi:hypothetical protein
VHLLVDTTLSNNKFSINAFMSRLLKLGDKALATEFVEVPCEVLFGEAEKVGVEMLSGGTSAKPLSDNEGLALSIKRLEELLEKVYTYVDDVCVSIVGRGAMERDRGAVGSRVGAASRAVLEFGGRVWGLRGEECGVCAYGCCCRGRLHLLPPPRSAAAAPQEGRCKGDPAIGRYLADTLSLVPHFGKAEFERLFNESVQDVMMVSYLSNLLRTQIALAEKLGTSQLPIM